MYTLTLSNGKVFTGLEVNGSCFVSKVEVKASDFDGGMKKVTLSGTPASEEDYGAPFPNGDIPRAKLGGVFPADGLWYFWLEQMSDEEFARAKDRADIDYIALMTGVEL